MAGLTHTGEGGVRGSVYLQLLDLGKGSILVEKLQPTLLLFHAL